MNPSSTTRRLLLLAGLSLSGAAGLVAQTTQHVRDKLAAGEYPEAITAANLAITANPANHDARFLRAYARLIDTIQKEVPALAKTYGANPASMNLFTDEIDIEFPEVVLYEKAGTFTKSGAKYTLPKGFTSNPELLFKNNNDEERGVSVSINTNAYWYASLVKDNGFGPGHFGEAYAYGGETPYVYIYDESGFVEAEDVDEGQLPRLLFNLPPGESAGLSLYSNDAALKFGVVGTLPAGVVATGSTGFTRTGNTFSLPGGYEALQPSLSFENKGATPHTLVLEFTGARSDTYFELDGNYCGFVNHHGEGYYGEVFDHGSVVSETSRATVTITVQPASVLNVVVSRAGSDFAVTQKSAAPKTLLVSNGSRAVGTAPKFKPGSNSSSLFSALTRLGASNTSVLQQIIDDLTALPADHVTRIGFQESVQGREILVAEADVQASLALLKFAQAVGLFSKGMNLSFDFSSPNLFRSMEDRLALFAASKSLFTAGPAGAAERLKTRQLFDAAAGHFLAAIDAGLYTRETPVDAEYLFAAGEPMPANLIEADGDGFRVTDFLYYQDGTVLAFTNTSATPQTLQLAIAGVPSDPSYFESNYTWLQGDIRLDGDWVAYLEGTQSALDIGFYDYNWETDEYGFVPYGSYDSGTGVWTVEIPAGSTLTLDLDYSVAGASFTPVGGLPAALSVSLEAEDEAGAHTRAELENFRASLTGQVPINQFYFELFGLGSYTDEVALPEDATYSLSPLFGPKPFNLRGALPEISVHGVRFGSSFPLLRSGIFTGVDIDSWEDFLMAGYDADMVTPLKATPIRIVTQPKSADVAFGGTTTLTVVADAYPTPTYQWLKISGSTTTELEGQTGPSLVISHAEADDAGSYRVRVTSATSDGSYQKTQLSAVAKVAVLTPPAITVEPSVPAMPVAASSAKIVLSVTATGSGPLKYQWFRDDIRISTASSAKLSVSRTTSASGTYRVVVTNTVGTAESQPVEILVLAKPAIKTQPNAVTVETGSTINLSVVALGSPTLDYQWFKDTEEIPDANSAILQIPEATGAASGDYHVVITNDVGSITSAKVKVTVNVAPKTFANRGHSITLVGSGTDKEGAYPVDSTFTITDPGKLNGVDRANDATGTATYTYLRTSATTATATATIKGPDGYRSTNTVKLTFTSPTGGTFTNKGSNNDVGAFTESGTFTFDSP